jgi:signal peptidase I
MNRRLIAVAALSLLTVSCSVPNSALHGEHSYTDPSAAMEPTIHRGQTFAARTVAGKYAPKRGDVVVFTMPSWGTKTSFVKRVIAIGGDTVACCSSRGQLMLNGSPSAEPYLAAGTSESSFGTITVPSGQLWVMGDNRAVSADSRFHVADPDHGFVPTTAVIGIAVLK